MGTEPNLRGGAGRLWGGTKGGGVAKAGRGEHGEAGPGLREGWE